MAAAGRCCILDIDVQGARLVRRSGLKAVFVFVAPPSSEELERRLRGRGTESEAQIAERLAAAKQEIARRARPATAWQRPVSRTGYRARPGTAAGLGARIRQAGSCLDLS